MNNARNKLIKLVKQLDINGKVYVVNSGTYNEYEQTILLVAKSFEIAERYCKHLAKPKSGNWTFNKYKRIDENTWECGYNYIAIEEFKLY
jgi:hypothetical protein